MANFVGFHRGAHGQGRAGRAHEGLAARPRLRVYASSETHTWIQKAADLAARHRRDPLDCLPTLDQRMDTPRCAARIARISSGAISPFLVVGTAGSVSTGAVDPLAEIAAICREHDLWFHVDGAYGGLAAQASRRTAEELEALSEADSVAVDPHKWLYAPLEAGCVLVRDRQGPA